jgi:hypothetical protein
MGGRPDIEGARLATAPVTAGITSGAPIAPDVIVPSESAGPVVGAREGFAAVPDDAKVLSSATPGVLSSATPGV